MQKHNAMLTPLIVTIPNTPPLIVGYVWDPIYPYAYPADGAADVIYGGKGNDVVFAQDGNDVAGNFSTVKSANDESVNVWRVAA